MPRRTASGAAFAIEIRDDQEIPAEDFHALFEALGFGTQTEAAEALGLRHRYASELWTGKRRVQPHTSLPKLIQLLYRLRQGGA